MSSFNNKTILITGATGLIGSHIVDYFMKHEDVSVLALSRSKSKLEKCFEKYMGHPRFKCIAQDISDQLVGKINQQVDMIFHAAGPMERKVIENHPLNVVFPNLVGTINCLELLKAQKERGKHGRLVLFSSVTVYANPTDEDYCVREEETNCTEALHGNNTAYSQSKRMSEVIAQAYRKEYGLDIVIARFSTVYGSTKFLPNTAFYEFINNAIADEYIYLQHACLPKRDNIFIDDAVRGVIAIAEKGISGEAYNVSSNGEKNNFASVDELATIITKEANLLIPENTKCTVCFMQDQEKILRKRPGGLRMDNGKLKSLGWNLKVSLEEGIRKTIVDIKKGSAENR